MLGYSVDEWRALPWWQERLYTEELSADLVRQAGVDADPGDAAVIDDDDDVVRVVPVEELGAKVIPVRFG